MIVEIKSDALYRPGDLAEVLSLNLRTIQKMLKSGTLPGCKIGGRWYTRGGDLLAMAGNDHDAAADEPGAEGGRGGDHLSAR